MLRTSIVRATGSSIRQVARPQASPAALVSVSNAQQTRQAHAISNPTLANIEKRWEAMPPQEQAELWMALRDRMKVDWNELTMQEKKAGTLESTAMLVVFCAGSGCNWSDKRTDGRGFGKTHCSIMLRQLSRGLSPTTPTTEKMRLRTF